MTRESRFVLGGIGAAVLLVIAVSVFAPADNADDGRPSTYNAGASGAKAAYMLLGRLGYNVARWDRPLANLSRADAAHETLVMANPWGAASQPEQHALAAFIQAGGRVLAIGTSGMINLPGYYWRDEQAGGHTCRTMPEGTSALAAAGSLTMRPTVVAKANLVETEVAQSCPEGAVVIEYDYGKGHAVWWTDPEPLSNRGLHNDANLKLFLASIGPPDRKVLFDEADNNFAPSTSVWAGAEGLPLRALAWQLLLGVVLLFFSFARRHGPRRFLTTTPRSSPLEFAYSMGNLYYRGKAGSAATREARERLLRVMERQCGIARDTLESGAEAIADELHTRLNYSNDELVSLLERSAAGTAVKPAEALKIVRSLNAISYDLRAAVSQLRTSGLTPAFTPRFEENSVV